MLVMILSMRIMIMIVGHADDADRDNELMLMTLLLLIMTNMSTCLKEQVTMMMVIVRQTVDILLTIYLFGIFRI